MSCTGCADALALGLARCLPCAHELAARRKELTAGLLAKIGPSANDLFTQQQPRARSKRR